MPVKIIIRDNGKESTFFINHKPKVFGRSPKCDFQLSDDQVSGRHFAIKVANNGRVIIKDLGSTNGIKLNGSNVTETYFKVNDILQLGSDVNILIDQESLSKKDKSKIDVNRQNMTRVLEFTKVQHIPKAERSNKPIQLDQKELTKRKSSKKVPKKVDNLLVKFLKILIRKVS